MASNQSLRLWLWPPAINRGSESIFLKNKHQTQSPQAQKSTPCRGSPHPLWPLCLTPAFEHRGPGGLESRGAARWQRAGVGSQRGQAGMWPPLAPCSSPPSSLSIFFHCPQDSQC